MCKKKIGSAELAFEHAAWMSKQYVVLQNTTVNGMQISAGNISLQSIAVSVLSPALGADVVIQ